MSIQAGCYANVLVRGPDVTDFEQFVPRAEEESLSGHASPEASTHGWKRTRNLAVLVQSLASLIRHAAKSELSSPTLPPISSTSPTISPPSDASNLESNTGGLSRTTITIIIAVFSAVAVALLLAGLYIVVRKRKFGLFGSRSAPQPEDLKATSGYQPKPFEPVMPQPVLPPVLPELNHLRSNQTVPVPEHEVLVDTHLQPTTISTAAPQPRQLYYYPQSYYYPQGFQDPQDYFTNQYQMPYQQIPMHNAQYYDQGSQTPPPVRHWDGIQAPLGDHANEQDDGHVMREPVEG
ncbi:hypothetical protein HDV05_000462 [Chytridiales sp. JEL 0842]|nr:hypothetical protein HDV05_000462 [Chytridiales sp. JEL 0842]